MIITSVFSNILTQKTNIKLMYLFRFVLLNKIKIKNENFSLYK